VDELLFLCFNCKLRDGEMKVKTGQASKIRMETATVDRFASQTRLNLNDLLKRRSEEKKVDRKTNLLIVSSASAVVAVVIVILLI